MPEHVVEVWERKGEKETQWTAACLACGWIGSDGTHAEAEHEGQMHERGERHPWQLRRGEAPKSWQPRDSAINGR